MPIHSQDTPTRLAVPSDEQNVKYDYRIAIIGHMSLVISTDSISIALVKFDPSPALHARGEEDDFNHDIHGSGTFACSQGDRGVRFSLRIDISGLRPYRRGRLFVHISSQGDAFGIGDPVAMAGIVYSDDLSHDQRPERSKPRVKSCDLILRFVDYYGRFMDDQDRHGEKKHNA